MLLTESFRKYGLSRRENMVFNILIVMGLGFIGLHAGSKFKRAPKP